MQFRQKLRSMFVVELLKKSTIKVCVFIAEKIYSCSVHTRKKTDYLFDDPVLLMDNKRADEHLLQKEAAIALNKTSTAKDQTALHISIDSQYTGRITQWLILSVLAAAGSSFIFGYNIGVINLGGNKIRRWISSQEGYKSLNATPDDPTGKNMSDKLFLDTLFESDKDRLTFIWSWVGGLFPLGAMIGGLASGAVADHFGRKGGMLINNILTFAAGLILFSTKYSGSYYVLWLGRFLIGVNCGKPQRWKDFNRRQMPVSVKLTTFILYGPLVTPMTDVVDQSDFTI
uniref:Major facilitator superfamily (MFS) profile domain-containing protein n=1 Tax=Romanomermis culicivorax TaxID=13658 RepID=A0A915IWD6_ROMCU